MTVGLPIMRREHCYYVYMVQSASRRALYIGMTGNLLQRVFQHKTHEFEGFTDNYNAVRLSPKHSGDASRRRVPRLHRIARCASDSVPLGMTE
jgi:predicted GIY-YIG superfamily endonuclease